MIETNLLESYDRLMNFAKKHLNDLFVLDGDNRVSARDRILREVIGNLLCHRDFSSGYIASMVIESDKLVTKNGNISHGVGSLKLESFNPVAKNPVIADVFRNIGWADELGSGMRNTNKFTKLYSGAEPIFEEGDMFTCTIPLKKSATGVKIGSTNDISHSASSTDIGLEMLLQILDFCNEPRTRVELQTFCGYKSPSHFREKILTPLITGGQLVLTIPEKPNSPKQRYARKSTYKP